jgi:hypothetical protein
MTTFSALKLTATKKPTQVPQVQQRRLKLAKRLWEQIELAKAEQSGTAFSVQKFRSYTDKESGLRKQIETNKRLFALSACGSIQIRVQEQVFGKRTWE